MNGNDIRRVDATILMVFLGCMRHRKATTVAKQMGLTQPAVSHALKRSRTLYNDPLYLRRAHGLEPTEFARVLEPKIRNIVSLISNTPEGQGEFEPERSVRTLKIGTFDCELTTLLPEFVQKLRILIPGIGIHTYRLKDLDALVDGRIDVAIGYFDFPANAGEAFVIEQLCSECYVTAARAHHPIMQGPVSVEALSQAEHLLVSPYRLFQDMVDHAIQQGGHKINIRTIIPSLFAALSIVEKTDLVVTLPKRVAITNAERFNLTYAPLPFQVGQFNLHEVRHKRDANSAVQTWLIDQIKSLIDAPQV
ncbi:MAG: LysR family transcriptional regulator [Pseudomonadota bacterium]